MRASIPIVVLLVGTLFTASASAGELSAVLGGLSWGDSPHALLDARRAMLMDEYRQRIEGLDDPLQIDRVRRTLDERFDAIANSHEHLEAAQTGFEVSVLAGEVRGAAGYSLITVRNRDNVEYFIFREGALVKLVQSFDLARLDFLGFDPFIDQLADVLGPPDEVEHRVDDIGRRLVLRAQWTDGVTRLRVENRAQLYNAYTLVFTDATREDSFVPPEQLSGPGARRGGGRVGNIMQSIEAQPEGGPSGDPGVVDRIIGRGTEDVRTVLRADEREAAEREARRQQEAEEAEEEQEAEEEGEARPRQRTRPRPAEREGETFY